MRWRDLLPSNAVVRSAFPRKRNGARLVGKRWNWGFRLAWCCVTLLSLSNSGPPVSSESPGWIYLRDGVPLQPGERLVEVLAVGDVMLGRGMAESQDIFDEVAGELQGADLTIGNLEGAIGTRPAAGVGIPLLLPPEAPARLAAAGFDLLSLANNHSLDAGTSGLDGTRLALQAVGIDPLENGRVAVREVAGRSFAFVGWNDLGIPSEEELLVNVRQADGEADHVIVIVHWGREYQRHPLLPQRELARRLFNAGADIILGSHPHVVQPLEVHAPSGLQDGAKLVAHSLGNFVFDQGWDDTVHGLALRLLFDAQGLRAAQALPLWTTPRPHWMDVDASAPLLERILESERVGFACSEERCWSAPVAADGRNGRFSSGAIDLTGDGVDEIVRRMAGVVEILEEGKTAWTSPPDWRVVDLDLGDPNEDGRFELLLAIEKTKESGEVTSQPFIIGYRGGTYRTLWGGSPVRAPLLELELGDVDGDGADELIVIEAPPGESHHSVSVWRWHGWGFGLVWRSPPGSYRDLILVPAPDGKQDVAVYP